MNPTEFATAVTEGTAELRQYAEARMASTADVLRKTGATTPNSDGYEVPEWNKIHTDIAFRSDGGSSSNGGSRTVTIGDVSFEQATGVGHFPASIIDLADDDYINVKTGEWAGDVYRIVAAVRYDQKTARRVPIVEASRPGEWA